MDIGEEKDKGLEATSKDPTNIVEALEYIAEGKNTEATMQACKYATEIYHCGAELDRVISMGIAYLEGYERSLVNHKILKSFVPGLKLEIRVRGEI